MARLASVDLAICSSCRSPFALFTCSLQTSGIVVVAFSAFDLIQGMLPFVFSPNIRFCKCSAPVSVWRLSILTDSENVALTSSSARQPGESRLKEHHPIN